MPPGPPRKRVDFVRVNRAALGQAEAILRHWLPDGRREGHEFVARNPKRSDRKPGSFKINLATGAWGDFAVGVKGRDLVSLAAYLGDLGQVEAAIALAGMIGVDPYE